MTFDTSTILILVAILAILVVGFLVMRRAPDREARPPREAEPYVASRERPYVKPREGNGVADEAAAAASDIAGEVLGVDAHAALSGAADGADRLDLLKGVGPKFAARLRELGVTCYRQLADLSPAELHHLDERLGPFRGRLARDRVAEQADYLARGDVDGFEEKFGKLGG